MLIHMWSFFQKLASGKSRMRTQIVITGNGCHMSSPLMETLLLETLTVTDDQWNVERPDLVPWLCALHALLLGQLE